MPESYPLANDLASLELEYPKEAASSRVLQLPEILRTILAFVGGQDVRRELHAACHINHLWAEIASELRWESCCAKSFLDPARVKAERRQYYANKIQEMTCFVWNLPFNNSVGDLVFPRLKRLELEYQGERLDPVLLHFLLSNCPRLQFLDICPPCKSVVPGSSHLQQFFLRLQSRCSVFPYGLSLGNDDFPVKHPENRHESLACNHVDDFLPLWFIRHFHIKELRLGQTLSAPFIRQFMDGEVCQTTNELKSDAFQYSEVIDLHMCHDCIGMLAPRLSSIQCLELTLLDAGDGAMISLSSLGSLSSLEVFFMKPTTLISADFRYLAKLSNLELLHLHDQNPRSALFSGLTPHDFQYTMKRLPRLTSLRLKLRANASLKSSDFRLFASLPSLQHLHLYDDDLTGSLFSELSAEDFECTVKCLPHLRSFGLHTHHNSSLTLASIREMGLHCTLMRYCLLSGPVLAEDSKQLEDVLPHLNAWVIAPFSVMWNIYQ